MDDTRSVESLCLLPGSGPKASNIRSLIDFPRKIYHLPLHKWVVESIFHRFLTVRKRQTNPLHS